MSFCAADFWGSAGKAKEGMLAKDNYSYKKYQKELARKKKAEEKKQRKLEKKAVPEAVESAPGTDGQDALE